MRAGFLRLPIVVAVGLTATAVAAQQANVIEVAKLQCAPLPPLEARAEVPQCRFVDDELVDLDSCVCPNGYLLTQLTAPAAIVPQVFSPG